MARIRTWSGWGVLVTGASSGIGAAIARRLAREGARLVLTARREDRLAALATELKERGASEVHLVPEDLGAEGGARRVAETATERLRGVEFLVNNAGFAVPGPLVAASWERLDAMLRVNVEAALELQRRLLPPMLAARRGAILNVASLAGFQASPFQAVYGASKAFLLNLSCGIHQEMRGRGVHVTALCPGVTDTEFFEAAGYPERTGFMRRAMDADRVARAGLRAVARGRMQVVPGAMNRAVVQVQRFLPRTWVAAAARRVLGARPRPTR